ncbi:MAG: class I SAM-dependent RNA methyltransferase [Chitinispirillales bacterium]|jgi:23S rRNA (uracil1939-C5)-methyltransferase|nr:class I SAM-dependent RNA methyltransferase [Chitinispirillales bacterium]
MAINTVLKIEKLVFGGHGLARDGGGVILIPDVAAGDVVEALEDGTKGGVRIGRVVKIVSPSPDRREPPCPYAYECGGCDWLHLPYGEQLRCKKDILIDCLTRIGKFDYPRDVEVFTAEEFGYRIRAQIKVDYGNNAAGFFRKRTNDVVRMDRCLLLDDRLNGILAGLNGNGINSINNNSGKRFHADKKYINGVSSVKILAGESVASDPVIDGLTNAATEINVSGIKFLADGGSFFQSNGFLLERLGRWAKGRLGGGFCLDLYGGIGFFSLMLADDFDEIVLVENVAGQVRAAERNFAVNKRDRIKAVLADVERDGSLQKILKGRRPDCVVVDPPRPGLVKTMRKWLIDTAPRRVLYVSCNPSTFARDAKALLAGGYGLTELALFDLYPNTHHMEVAGIFVR